MENVSLILKQNLMSKIGHENDAEIHRDHCRVSHWLLIAVFNFHKEVKSERDKATFFRSMDFFRANFRSCSHYATGNLCELLCIKSFLTEGKN